MIQSRLDAVMSTVSSDHFTLRIFYDTTVFAVSTDCHKSISEVSGNRCIEVSIKKKKFNIEYRYNAVTGHQSLRTECVFRFIYDSQSVKI